MKKCKISPATLARTAALALALTNQVLSATGHRVLPIESAELEQLGSTVPFWLSAFVLKHRLRKWHPRPTSCGRHPRHPV